MLPLHSVNTLEFSASTSVHTAQSGTRLGASPRKRGSSAPWWVLPLLAVAACASDVDGPDWTFGGGDVTTRDAQVGSTPDANDSRDAGSPGPEPNLPMDSGSGEDASSESDASQPFEPPDPSDAGDVPVVDAGEDVDSGAEIPVHCDLPKTFRWKASGPLIAPKSPAGRNFVSIKDPTVVYWNNRYHVYATVFDRSVPEWSMVYLNFADWSDANNAPQYHMANSPTRGGVAPQVFYFKPKNKWVLVYQWGASYSTTDDLSKPQTWTPRAPLLRNAPQGAIDFWVICNDTHCYLFFSDNRGRLYQAKMPIDQFPGTFDNAKVLMSDPVAGNLFEAANVYKIKGTDQYLLLVEAYGPRYFRSWTATNLEGPWTPLAATQQQPFAGRANVTFEGAAWTNDISHGDMIRDNPDETMTIDACNMRYVFQGTDPNVKPASYDLTPYRIGLLTPLP